MHAMKKDLPVEADLPPVKVQSASDWGDFQTQIITYKVDTDLGPLLQGLPDNQCQSPHWGYIVKGRMRVIYSDHEEELNEGELFYMAPGHRPIIEAGTEMIQFSPKGPALDQTTEVLRRNTEAMMARAGSHS